MIYVRHQNPWSTSAVRVEVEPPRVFEPLRLDHPLVMDKEMECPACRRPFRAGDLTVLIPLGPGEDPEARVKAKEGRYYNAVAAAVHAACAGLE